MKNIRNFVVYGDSWFEINKLIKSIKKTISLNNNFLSTFEEKEISLKEYIYRFKISYKGSDINLNFTCLGKYKDNINNKYISEMLDSGGKPDILIFENNEPILGIEDTDTSQIGNSSLQRMDRIIWFIKNKISFLYLTYYTTFDRSGLKLEKRRPSAAQSIFFEQNENLEILYKDDQNIQNESDDELLGRFFINKFINIKQQFLNSDKLKNDIKLSNSYKELNLFLNNDHIINENVWKPNFLSDSLLLSELSSENKLFTFSKKSRQKVGFVKSIDLINKINEISGKKVDFKNISLSEYVLINPIMFAQKKDGTQKIKVDPATGEFVFYSELFKKYKNVALIYSKNATEENIQNSNNKLTYHIKHKSDLILLSNKQKTKIIDKNLLKEYHKIVKNISVDEDDIDFALYNFLLKNNYECLYISAPGSSWSRITYKENKIIDVSKIDKRPDYIFINDINKTIIIGESKFKYRDLICNRNKNISTFDKFKSKLLDIDAFKKYNIFEINLCVNEKNISPKFSLITINVKNNLKFKVNLEYCKENYLFSNNK